MKKVIWLLILVTLAGSAYYGYQYYWPSQEVVEFNPGQEPVVYLEGRRMDEEGLFLLEGDQLLMAVPLIENMTSAHFFWDQVEETLVVTTGDYAYRFQPLRTFYMINGRAVDLEVPMQVVHNKPFIPVSFLESFLEVDWIFRQTDQVLVLEEQRNCRLVAEVITEKAVIRQAPHIKASLYPETLFPGDQLLVYETYEHWLKIRTETGLIGFIQKKDVKRYEDCRPEQRPASDRKADWQPERGKINLVWEHVHLVNPDPSNISAMPGVDVISPTWYEISDESGTVTHRVSQRYIDWSRSNGYELWPLVSNGFDPDRTSVFLASTRIRESIIDELLASMLSYEMDGVNIDFENVYLDDRDLVTQFMRELTPLFREAGLVVSMDVTIRSGSEMWSMFYDREALGEIVDYMAVMTYDQHWGSSPVAGSVAQYQWVENGLKGILEQVPAEKILLGLPLYTRVWEEREADGSVRVSSRAISMGQLNQIINTRQLQPEWDEESGQYYTEYAEGESRFRIWIEDARSIDLKSSLVHRYDLAGAASWRRGFESTDIWDVLEHNLKEMNDYASWAHARGLTDLYF